MKLSFKVYLSYTLLFFSQLYAYGPVHIDFSKHEQKALLIKKIMMKEFNIPTSLVTLHQSKGNHCNQRKYPFHILVNDNNEMIIHHVDHLFIKNNLGQFNNWKDGQ